LNATHDGSALRIVIAGGGTGGHVLPAVATIAELNARGIPFEAIWIGSESGMERGAADEAGVAYHAIKTGKLRRYFSLETAVDAGRLPVGAIQARRLLRAFRPAVVLSTGGFVSVPTVVAARGIAPVLTHEQTTIVGLATRINLQFANVLALSYDRTRDRIKGGRCRVVVTGNPVRSSLATGDPAAGLARFGFSPDFPLVYVTGGARGASPLNQRIEAMLPDLLTTCQILHQAGPSSVHGDAERLRALRDRFPGSLKPRYHVVEFVRDELADVYAAASLVVARAGAGTVAELAFLGKPSLLIPLPLSGGGEQDVNARMLADAGAAQVLPQSEARPDRLRAEIDGLLANPERLRAMSERAASLAHPDAAARLADELLVLAGYRIGA